MTWLFGFISGIAATLTVAVVLSRILSKNEFISHHKENMVLLREGHAIMERNGVSIERIAEAIAAASSQQSDLDMVLLPRALTAENGAKALLIGEFFEEHEYACPICGGVGGLIERDEDEDLCELCQDTGGVTVKVPVSWPTIKAIYAKIVEHYGK